MLFSIGNLITLVIVLVFFFIYHRLTANNRSLEKVKRLADKLQNELNDYVAVRAEELKHYGIDLDVQQKAAKIALEKLQTAQEAVAGKADSIGAIADRFKEYDEVLSRLMEMTARVDENLARIHEDEAFAESVNRKLDLAKKSLTALERELPLQREAFAQDAQKTVDAFRDDILSELQEGLSATSTELNAVRDEAMAAFTQAQSARALVDAELEKALETAKERASSIEDAAFTTITNDFDGKLLEVRASVDQQFGQLGQETARHAGELRSAITDFKDSWQTEAQTMLDDIRGKFSAAESGFETKVRETTAVLERSLTMAREAEASLGSTAEQSKQSVADTLSRLSALEESLKKSMEETETRIEEEFAAFGQAFEDHRTRFEENFMAETTAINAAVGTLKQDIESLKAAAYENAAGKLSGFEDELLADLSDKKAQTFKQLDSWLSGMEKTLAGITTEASARRNAEEAKYSEEFHAHMLKLRDELHAQLEKLSQNIDAVRENIVSKNAAAEVALEDMQSNLRDEARAMMDDSLAGIRAEIEDLREKAEQLSAEKGQPPGQ